MKTFFWLPKAACKLSNPLTQRLHWSSFAAILFVALLASAWPATAKVVYTPVNVTIRGNGSIEMDLNHDGTNDFKIQASVHGFICGNRGGIMGLVTINPTMGNGIVVKSSDFAALLPPGVQINSRANFYKAKTEISSFSLACGRPYWFSASGYLGLEFQFKGKTHYGWALVNVYARFLPFPSLVDTTLIGFAYETIPGSPINTGQISGAAADLTAAGPGSTEGSSPEPAALESPDETLTDGGYESYAESVKARSDS